MSFVDKIVVHECEKKDVKRTQDIDIYYSYVGIMYIPTDEEMRWIMQSAPLHRHQIRPLRSDADVIRAFSC